MKSASRGAALTLALLSSAGCGRQYEGGGELRAQRVVLQREVDGLRETVALLERGEPVFSEKTVAVAIDEALVRELVAAELPFEADSGDFHLTLREAEVHFQGAPTVRLRGELTRAGVLDLRAAVEVIGALADTRVDHASASLTARIAVDHLGIEKVAGLEALVSGSTLDEIARALRLAIADALPPIRIPVKVEEAIELPAVTHGPVRIAGARMPIAAAVERVFAGQGRLWIGIGFVPGELVKTTDPPEARDLTAEEAGVSLEDEDPPADGDAKPAKTGEPGR